MKSSEKTSGARVKNWSRFQHYQNRRPPWIRLYRDLLDDPDFHALSGNDVKFLLMIWLIASEDESCRGNLPSDRKTAFRLRIAEKELRSVYGRLEHWIIVSGQDASGMLGGCKQSARAETESETESEKISAPARMTYTREFEEFWKAYPPRNGSKYGKKPAFDVWKRVKDRPQLDVLIQVLTQQKKTKKWLDGFIPDAQKWLRHRAWEDELISQSSTSSIRDLDEVMANRRR